MIDAAGARVVEAQWGCQQADEGYFAPFITEIFASSGKGDCRAVPGCSWLYSIMSLFSSSSSSVHVCHYHPHSLLAAGPFFPIAFLRSDVSVKHL